MNLQGRSILVVGAGKSGIESCRFLLSRGAKVILSDTKEIDQLGAEIAQLEKSGVQMMLGNQFPENIDWDLVVTSPGVPPMIPIISMSRAAGCEIIGEVELAYRFSKTPYIGVTGTNGKTTTTALLGAILQDAEKHILVGGNIGEPLAVSAASFEGDYIVAELSSFQLESCIDFHAKIAVYLNLTPDHLDRHGNMEAYAEAKSRLFVNMQADDIAILNWDDMWVRRTAEQTKARIMWFSLREAVDDGMYFDGKQLILRENGQTLHSFDRESIYIKGMHNVQNAMAAGLAAISAGVSYESLASTLAKFPGVEHRLEFVCEKDGVCYINDSKGTNPASTYQALLAYDQPLVLLLGGYDKGSDFAPLFGEINKKVRRLVIYGATLPILMRTAEANGFTAYEKAENFRDAVQKAKATAQSGDIVLLSPACASWDEFDNYEQRGNVFKELVLS